MKHSASSIHTILIVTFESGLPSQHDKSDSLNIVDSVQWPSRSKVGSGVGQGARDNDALQNCKANGVNSFVDKRANVRSEEANKGLSR